jgi:pimeloyl-ACP methyl ester carboxylesterase
MSSERLQVGRSSRSVRVALQASLLLALFGSAVRAQQPVRVEIVDTAPTAVVPLAVPGCPNQSGILDSISVPVNQPLTLSVVIFSPAPAGGATFRLSSDNPAYVAAGDKKQGFLPVVTVPEGETISNPFTIFGISVGQTLLRITPLTSGFLETAFPLGAWDVNQSGIAIDRKFVDANDPVTACRDPGASSLTSDPALQATCGTTVKGVASDGVNSLLLRTVSGLTGTACFEVVSSSPLDQGTIQTPLTSTQPVSSLQYGFSYYTPPGFYGDSSDQRTVTVEFTFTPDIGNGNTSRVRAQMTIVRPPVMLLHGVWSDAGSWSKDYLRNDASHTTFAGGYKSSNGASFATNQPKVQGFIDSALKLFRRKGYGATQADVIAHSMGGLLTRLYAGSASFKRPDNLDRGDVHRLITLDTPHFGSNFANLLVALHNVNPTRTESVVSGITGGSVVGGAVCDLAENSPALHALAGGTSLAGQFITGSGGPAGTPTSPASYWNGATIFGLKSFESALTDTYCTNWVIVGTTPVCTNYQPYFPQATVDAFRFRESNDAVVPLSSQQGGLAGIDFPAYIHFHIPGIPGVQRGITDGQDVATRALQILDGPDSGLTTPLPAVQADGTGGPRTVPGRGAPLDQQDYASQCGPGGPMKTASSGHFSTMAAQALVADPRVTVASPVAGTVFTQDDTMTIVVELMPPLTAANTVGATLEGLKHVTATWTSDLQFTATFVIPRLVAGPLTITPDFTDPGGNLFTGAPVVVGVHPATPPVSLSFQQHAFLVAPGTPPIQLVLNGTFSDGSVLDLSAALAGATYESSDPSVLTVDADGLVQIVGPGFASITGLYGSLADVVTFVVEDPTSPLPPADLTANVSISKTGFRLDRNTGFFVQRISLTNTSGDPLPASLYLVFSGLTEGVTLVNKSGLTESLPSVGSPYLSLTLPGEGLTLPPGATVRFTLQFLNPDRSTISYSVALLRTSLSP